MVSKKLIKNKKSDKKINFLEFHKRMVLADARMLGSFFSQKKTNNSLIQKSVAVPLSLISFEKNALFKAVTGIPDSTIP